MYKAPILDLLEQCKILICYAPQKHLTLDCAPHLSLSDTNLVFEDEDDKNILFNGCSTHCVFFKGKIELPKHGLSLKSTSKTNEILKKLTKKYKLKWERNKQQNNKLVVTPIDTIEFNSFYPSFGNYTFYLREYPYFALTRPHLSNLVFENPKSRFPKEIDALIFDYLFHIRDLKCLWRHNTNLSSHPKNAFNGHFDGWSYIESKMLNALIQNSPYQTWEIPPHKNRDIQQVELTFETLRNLEIILYSSYCWLHGMYSPIYRLERFEVANKFDFQILQGTLLKTNPNDVFKGKAYFQPIWYVSVCFCLRDTHVHFARSLV